MKISVVLPIKSSGGNPVKNTRRTGKNKRASQNTSVRAKLEVRRTCFSPLFPHGYTKNFTSLMNVNFDSADSQRRGRSQVASTFLTYLYVGLLMRWFSRVRFIAIFSTSKHVWVWLSTGDTNNSIKYFISLFRVFGRIWHIISFFPLILMLIFWRRCLRGSTSFSQARAGERVGPALSGRPNVAQPWPKLYLLLKRGIP